ncbi:MAG: AraC family transcriptional regulator [Lachnospiraceae bacterium]|nr:AraC family transcriptional regulator [Lachnospiraceae bacterium]
MTKEIPYDPQDRFRILTGDTYRDYDEFKSDTASTYPISAYTASIRNTVLSKIRWHWHHDSELALVVDGSADFHVSDAVYTIPKGQGIIINHSILHSVTITEGFEDATISFVIFNTSFFFGKSELMLYERYVTPVMDNVNIPCHVLKGDTEGSREILDMVPKIVKINVEQTPFYELYTREYLLHTLIITLKYLSDQDEELRKQMAALHNKKSSLDEIRTKEAIRFIEQHFADSITLDDIAESIHVSKSECCRCIKRCMGMTPFEYLLRYRIMIAASKLQRADEKISISELAASVGFNSSSYFNKLFRKYIGDTPTVFRNKRLAADIPPLIEE